MPALIPVDDTLGALLLGALLSSIVYGMTWIQFYMYHTEHSLKDSWPLKTFVTSLMVLDTIQIAFQSHAIYDLTVTNFGDYLSDVKAPWTLYSCVPLGLVLSIGTQLFYALRLYRLSNRNTYAPLAICAASSVELGFGIKFTVLCFTEPINPYVKVPFSAGCLAAEVACNLLITGWTIFYLTRSGGGLLPNTRGAIVLLVTYIMSSGALNLMFSIACLITFVATPAALTSTAFFAILSRLYLCSLLAILNSRGHVHDKLFGTQDSKDNGPAFIEVHTNGRISFFHNADRTATSHGQEFAIMSPKKVDGSDIV